jgi:cytochrome c heme-lyase
MVCCCPLNNFPLQRHLPHSLLHTKQTIMAAESSASAESCPVDPKTREAWLAQAQSQAHSNNKNTPPQPQSSLQSSRVISTIPRASTTSSSPHAPNNSEQETGTSKSGHWIYPSEKQFYAALQRKKFEARPEDMSSIVPIHNAVNERAWNQILGWEKGRGSESCGGPKLASFEGNSQKLTPKAWLNSFLGYSKPFDRHDWVVERCGVKIDYVIDFYEGKTDRKNGKPINFYLDVRPKLNSWEGCKMRIERFMGF